MYWDNKQCACARPNYLKGRMCLYGVLLINLSCQQGSLVLLATGHGVVCRGHKGKKKKREVWAAIGLSTCKVGEMCVVDR
jgi:hypothetical protein